MHSRLSLRLRVAWALLLPMLLIPVSSCRSQEADPATEAAALRVTRADWSGTWPRFRGPDGSGVAPCSFAGMVADGELLRSKLWKTRLALPGANSPLIWGKRVFTAGADRDRRDIYCLDAQTGDIQWVHHVAPDYRGDPPRLHGMTGYAPATGTVDGDRLYWVFPTGHLVALDHDGNPVWDRWFDMSEDIYGHSTSLVLYQRLLIVQIDLGKPDIGKSHMVALDCATGETVWEVPRPVQGSWTTPIVIEAGERHELVTSAKPWVIAYDPTTGNEYWRVRCIEGDSAPSPIYADGHIFVANIYAELTAIRPGGAGDVTATHVRWSTRGTLPDICSPLSDGVRVWTLSTGGVLSCYRADGGEMLYGESLGMRFRSSPSLVGETLLLLSEAGDAVFVGADDTYQLLGRSSLGEPVHSCPAFAHDMMLIRGERHIFAFGCSAAEH